MIRPATLTLLAALVLPVAACSGGSSGATDAPATGCGEVERERFDPDSAVHVLPGAEEPTYLTDPPTSGPHAPTAAVGGVRDQALGRSEQVGLLEAGIVLIQHDPSLPAADQAELEALADPDDVLVAPNPDLPAPVVATAWTRKLRCSTVADGGLEALRDFAATQAGAAPGTDG